MEIMGVKINLNRRDWIRVGSLLLVMVVVGNLGGLTNHALVVQRVMVPLTLLAMVFGIYFTIKTKQQWGGQMGRFLDMQAVAMTLLTYMWILTVVVNQGIPLFGIPTNYWLSYMYSSGGAGFVTAVYSFYLLNSGGQ
ncbi:MAG: hypothetical protein ABEJ75_01380 [Candidatus Nanohaloarchaea archaeon]